MYLSVSIVLYYPDFDILKQTLHSLHESLDHAKNNSLLNKYSFTLIDNSIDEEINKKIRSIIESEYSDEWKLITPKNNQGYGQGHNFCLTSLNSDYHLILNPDVVLEKEAIIEAIVFMHKNNSVGMLTPKAYYPSGRQQYLCKQYPTVFDLFLRGFAPRSIKKIYKKRLAFYEMQEITGERVVDNIPIASGCFMFVRKKALDMINGFSPKYFLYFEDFDLSVKLKAKGWHITYVPSIVITHYGGNTAKKGLKHIFLFISSAFKFFKEHGWKIY